MEYPFTSTPFESKIIAGFPQQKIPDGPPPTLYKLVPGNWVITGDDMLNSVRFIWHNFESRKTDVWISTPPKCGTTWMQELTWILLNSLNFEKAKKINQFYRSPYIEFGGIGTEESPDLTQLEQSHENVPIFMKQSLIYTTKIMKESNTKIQD